jgi:hypothetical protein
VRWTTQVACKSCAQVPGLAAHRWHRPCIQGTPERVIVERAGWNAWSNEARDRLRLEKMGHEVELWLDKAEAVEHQGLHRMTGGHHPHGRVLRRRLIHACSDAEFCKHPRAQTYVLSDLRAVRLRRGREGRAVRASHSLLLCRRRVYRHPKMPQGHVSGAEWRVERTFGCFKLPSVEEGL